MSGVPFIIFHGATQDLLRRNASVRTGSRTSPFEARIARRHYADEIPPLGPVRPKEGSRASSRHAGGKPVVSVRALLKDHTHWR
jgi:hypothetical protein